MELEMDSFREQLATRSDWSLLKIEIVELRSELRTEIAQVKVEILRWMFGLFFAQVGLVLGLVYFLVDHGHR